MAAASQISAIRMVRLSPFFTRSYACAPQFWLMKTAPAVPRLLIGAPVRLKMRLALVCAAITVSPSVLMARCIVSEPSA